MGKKKRKINKINLNKMAYNKLVLTVADGSEKVLDFTQEVNVEDLARTTVSKVVATEENGTVTTFTPGQPAVETIKVPLNTPVQLEAR